MLQYRMGEASCKQKMMASSEAEPKKLKLGVSDHASHARTGGGGEGETKKPTKRSDFSLDYWVSVLCCGATVPACASIIYNAARKTDQRGTVVTLN